MAKHDSMKCRRLATGGGGGGGGGGLGQLWMLDFLNTWKFTFLLGSKPKISYKFYDIL